MQSGGCRSLWQGKRQKPNGLWKRFNHMSQQPFQKPVLPCPLRPAAAQGPIHASVEWLDRQGMSLIEAQDAQGFAAYLKRYGNTICGRHPTAVLLHALAACPQRFELRFRKYDQSHRCTDTQDSSVSYAAAVAVATGSEDGAA